MPRQTKVNRQKSANDYLAIVLPRLAYMYTVTVLFAGTARVALLLLILAVVLVVLRYHDQACS